MLLSVRQTLPLLALAVLGCQTHDRVVYHNPVPWKSHPVAVQDALTPTPTEVPGTPGPITQPETAPAPGISTPGPVEPSGLPGL